MPTSASSLDLPICIGETMLRGFGRRSRSSSPAMVKPRTSLGRPLGRPEVSFLSAHLTMTTSAPPQVLSTSFSWIPSRAFGWSPRSSLPGMVHQTTTSVILSAQSGIVRSLDHQEMTTSAPSLALSTSFNGIPSPDYGRSHRSSSRAMVLKVTVSAIPSVVTGSC